MDWIRDKFEQIENKFIPEEPEPADQTLLEQLNEGLTLTRTQRLLGFLVSFGMGMLLSLMAPMFILRPVKLATTLSLGNLLSVGSMMFLVGPTKQCASMMDSSRWIATSIYLASLILTLIAAFLFKSRLICLVCIVVQYAALAWYSLSYIPYGQAMVMRFLGRTGATGDGFV
jgi:hypothetical protein